MTAQVNNDIVLLDTLKDGFELQSDAELAGFLGITRGAIYTVRHKTGRLGPKAKFMVFDKIGFLGIRNWAERLTANYISRRLYETSINRASIILKVHIPADSEADAELFLPDELRLTLNINSDEELAQILGINRNTISMVRKGKSKLGIGPKLKVLQTIDKINQAQVNEALNNPDVLIRAILNFAAANNRFKEAVIASNK